MTWLPDAVVDRLREPRPGPDLSDTRYRIDGELGRGGMGTVYLATDTELEREVAIKVPTDQAAGEEEVERLRAEARIIARLDHPGIVPVHDVGWLPDGRVFYVMKRVRGQRLDEAVARMPLGARLRLLERVCDTIGFAHAHGVVHRDLKPENVMVGEFGEVLVMDWGVAKKTSAGAGESALSPSSIPGNPLRETAHGAVIGTPEYMAPEQATGDIDAVGPPTDVYALGGILHFLLAGRPPHAHDRAPGPPLLESAGGSSPNAIPRALAAICRKALEQNPAARYRTAAEFQADLLRFLDGLPVSAHPDGLLDVTWRWLTRHRVAIALVLTYLVMRLLLLAWAHR